MAVTLQHSASSARLAQNPNMTAGPDAAGFQFLSQQQGPTARPPAACCNNENRPTLSWRLNLGRANRCESGPPKAPNLCYDTLTNSA